MLCRVNLVIIAGMPIAALYGALTTELQTKTLVLAAIFYFLTGFGITGGKQHHLSTFFFLFAHSSACVTHHFQATTVFGHTKAGTPSPRSASWSSCLAPPPSRALPAGGAATTVLTTSLPTQPRCVRIQPATTTLLQFSHAHKNIIFNYTLGPLQCAPRLLVRPLWMDVLEARPQGGRACQH